MPSTEAEALSPEQVSNKTREVAASWLDKIKTREKFFEDHWWKKAENAVELYEGGKVDRAKEKTPYNILYSNTEVLLPSLYSATPKPDVRGRYENMNLKPLPELIERFLTVAADPASPGGDCFDNAMSDAVLAALVPGMGYVRVKYIENRSFPLSFESGHYKTLIWAKANRWAKVPWIAFKHAMTKDQMFEKFSIEELDQVGYEPDPDLPEDQKDACVVYELWDKTSRKVYFLSEQWHDRELQVEDDPLSLENFFPTPGPLLLTANPGKFEPIPLYEYYQNQAEELNRVSVRLNKVLSAIRVRGAYNGLLGADLEKLLGADDTENALIPASEAGLITQTGGLDKHIWMLPIDKFIVVAQELYRAREAIKQVIYEITGISDIIRGSSAPSETATAQDLKNKWGTVRLRKMQTIVANYARDFFRMSVDCGASVIPPEMWKTITQMDIPTAQEKQIAQQQMAYQQQAQTPPMPGMPPPPTQPPDPKLQATLSSPTIEEVLQKITSDQNRTFIINIQTSSTIDLDTAQDKAEVSEFMNAMGQLLAGLQPLASLGPTGLEASKAILMAVCNRFKFGIDIAPIIGKIQAQPPQEDPKNKGPSPEEQQALQAESQFKMAEISAKMEVMEAQKALDLAKIEAEKQKLSIDIQKAQISLQKAQLAASQPKAPNAAVSA